MSSGFYARQADSFLDEAMRGEWFSGGRGPLTVPNGSALRGTLENPLGSGKLVIIHRLRVYVTTPSEYMTISLNPTTNLPATVVANPNRRIGSPNSTSIVKIDVGSPMSGGTLLPYSVPIEVNSNTFTEFIIHPGQDVPPGVTIGFNYTNAGGGPASQAIILTDIREVLL